jgi:nitroimidazol reductase NimA-like FMN-containing flavoprotein (pyridoxamine 5'-phosphate oxidase superfamily)
MRHARARDQELDSTAVRDAARAIVDDNLYLVLATADADGLPWVSPVYFAHEEYRRFIWVSAPDATHSRNIAVRPTCSIVIFDSRVPVNSGQAVYMSATAEEVTETQRERLAATFSDRSQQHGASAWTSADVEAPARLRLYVATADEQFVLGERDERISVSL